MPNVRNDKLIFKTPSGPTSGRRGQIALLTTALLATLLMAGPSHAQRDVQDRIDFLQIRSSVGERRAPAVGGGAKANMMIFSKMDKAGTPPPQDHLSFDFEVPFLYNTNAGQASMGAVNSFETVPSAHMDFHTNIPSLNTFFRIGGDATVDRFTASPDANNDSVVGEVLLQYRTLSDAGKRLNSNEFSPFIKYGPQLAYAPFFGTQTSAVHDLMVGFDKGFTLNGDILSASLRAYATRRISETSASSYKLHVRPQIVYAWTNTEDRPSTESQWSATFKLDIDRRTFDGSNKENWTLTPVLSIEYDFPARWFGDTADSKQANYKAYGAPRLVFQAAYNWVSSNVADSSWTQWTFGPVLQAGWKF